MSDSKMDAAEISHANTAFGLDLTKVVFPEYPSPNVFISPYSISVALGMTHIGAGGLTKKEMLKVLHWKKENEAQFHEQYQKYLKMLSTPSEKFEMHTANRIYIEQMFEMQEGFRQKTRDYYMAEPDKADFANNAESERHRINAWAAEQTKQKIKNLLPPGILSQDTRMVLCNAIYFKGKWQSQFEAKNTIKRDFHVSEGEIKKVDMMMITEDFSYIQDKDLRVTAVELPYKGNELSMVIILPDEKFGLKKLIEELTAEKLHGLLDKLDQTMTKVDLFLPKFEMVSYMSLVKTLQDLGMADAFSDSADFRGILQDVTGMKISDVIHKAFIRMDEEGTEAAAVTAVIELECEVCYEEDPEFMMVDHPFLFLMKDKRADSMVLFLGKVEDPSMEPQEEERPNKH